MVFRALRAVFGHRSVFGIAWIAAAVFLSAALVSHSPEDPVPLLTAGRNTAPSNWLGPMGAFLSEVTLQLVGWIGFAIPVLLFEAGRKRLWPAAPEERTLPLVRGLIFSGLAVSVTGLAALAQAALGSTGEGESGWGGLLGELVASGLSNAMNPLGAGLVLGALGLIIGCTSLREWGPGSKPARERRKTKLAKVMASIRSRLRSRPEARSAPRRFVFRIVRKRAAPPPPPESEESGEPEEEAAPAAAASGGIERRGKRVRARSAAPPDLLRAPNAAKNGARESRPWKLPSLQLLTRRAHQPAPGRKALEERRKALEAACLEHGVRGQVDRIQPGPVVTTFEFRLGEGETLNKLKNRHEEICMALRAPAIRVERIRGKGVVGIEVPNETPSIVGLREILEAPEFQTDKGALPVAVGRLVDGRPLVKNLADMPHLLIAGATGAGKSVQINTLLCSLLIRCAPDELRLILIDPKRVELRPYRNIPHLLTPLILEPDKAKTVLQHACRELDRRTRILEEHGVRNIDGYNRQVERLDAERTGKRRRKNPEEAIPKPMPRLVIVVDELADLFIHAKAEVTPAIQRLLSLGRAEGIHLVLATQRPSTDIVSGTLKANLPTRIAFRVASYVDSRTILDRVGAEGLLGKGDMLMMRPGADLPRAQGGFVDEKEVGRLVAFWESAAEPAFDETMLEEEVPGETAAQGAEMLTSLTRSPGPGASARGGGDSLLPQARELIVREQKASTSMLQTELGLGYQRARRIVAELERQGIVGPSRGAQPREVLVQQ